jgi:hypothetical protein
MEVLGVVASVVGLVSLTIQIIDKLQALADKSSKDWTQTQPQQLANDIASSIALLDNVQNWANRAKALRLSSQSEILIHSLTVQLEDYLDQLKAWDTRGMRALRVSSTEPFKRVMGYKSRGQRTTNEMIASYGNKIGGTLTIIGRFVHISLHWSLYCLNTAY